MIVPKQRRFIDPYKTLSSEDLNKRLKAIFPDGNAILKGCDISTQSSAVIKITPGIVLIDYVLVEITEDIVIDVSTFSDTTYYIKGVYKFTVSCINELKVVVDTEVTDDDIVFACVEVRNGTVKTIDLSCRTKNPLIEQVNQVTIDSDLYEDIDLNHHKITQLADCESEFSDTDAINLCYLKKIIGLISCKVKVTSSDSEADYLGPKIITNTYLHKEIITDDNGHEFIKLTADDNKVYAIDGDSTEGFLSNKISVEEPLKIDVIYDVENGNQLNISLDTNALASEIGSALKYVVHFTDSSDIMIEHNLGTTDLSISIFDSDNHMILADDVQIMDENTIRVKFTTLVSGKIVIIGFKTEATLDQT